MKEFKRVYAPYISRLSEVPTFLEDFMRSETNVASTEIKKGEDFIDEFFNRCTS